MDIQEKEAIEKQFERNLELLVREKFPLTATAIVSAEQPMILLFKELIHRIEKREYELDKKDKIINEYEKECKKTRGFARRIRKYEKRDIDQFNQGKEFASIQFLNLLANEPHWDYEGKYFDEVDREIGRYLKKAEGN